MSKPILEQNGLSSQLFELAPDASIVIDNGGKIVLVNVLAETLFGYQRDEILGKPLQVLIPEYSQSAHQDHQSTDQAKLAVRATQTTDRATSGLHKNGAEILVECRLSQINAGEHPLFCVAIRDLSERANQFLQTGKLEAVAQLVGGIAHDLNNLLSVITGFTSMAMEDLGRDDPLHRDLKLVFDAGEKSADLTRHLLALSRGHQLQPIILDLNAVVARFEARLRLSIEENIHIQADLDPDLAAVEVDPGQIEQILVNLTNNAREAMPAGGSLTLKTANAVLTESEANEHVGLIPGCYVTLSVSDTGTGMDEETGSQALEPFFTTKETSKGSGLGLATVYGMIKQSNGHILVYSNPGEGTSIEVFLPQVERESAKVGMQQAAAEVVGGSETILVVEDDESVLEFIVRALQDKGYQLVTARHLGEALQVWQDHEGQIDLLLTDLGLPGGTGVELAEQTMEISPGRKLLYMSGYADTAPHHVSRLEWEKAFLRKPFTASALARKVREILDQSEPGST